MRPLALLLVLSLAACADPEPDPAPAPAPGPAADEGRQTVADVAEANPQLGTLARLLDVSGLGATLADTAATYTLFAPTDAAFDALGADAVAALEADSAAARTALLDHVLATRLLSVDVFPDLAFESVGGAEITFAEADGGLAVRSGGTTAQITAPDLDAENGVVHVIDTVLTP